MPGRACNLIEKTRLRSSRMRTARALTVSDSMLCRGECLLPGGGVCSGGGCLLLGRGVCSRGVSAPGEGVSARGVSALGGVYPSMH